jgi:hypothetical protein
MRTDFILKAHERASKKRKKEIEQEFSWLFEIKLENLKVGATYKVTNLVYGCQGFPGEGMVTKVKHKHGLKSSDKGVNMLSAKGIIWRVNGVFHPSKKGQDVDNIVEKLEI